jgi:hypothetical protein
LALLRARRVLEWPNEPIFRDLKSAPQLAKSGSHALGRTDAGRPLHISFTLRGGGKLNQGCFDTRYAP